MHDSVKEYWNTHFASKSFDLRLNPYRHMDQKCTPDIVHLVAECIISLPLNDTFTSKDIQTSSVLRENLQFYFNKPDPTDPKVANEIDKVVSQPLKTLTFAGILSEEKNGRAYQYKVVKNDALETLAMGERQCFKFICALNEKTFQDSGLNYMLSEYESSLHSVSDYTALRDGVLMFYRKHTKLGSRGSKDSGTTEFRRIFPKIINPISVERGIPGVVGGSPTRGAFIYQELMYNRPNFRDMQKNKNLSRAENLALAAENSVKTKMYLANECTKAKRRVLQHHKGSSEVKDSLASGKATQAHHIFPVSKYPELQAVHENIISLTASQHYQRAHPNNNTNLVDPEYQRTCLLSKLESVRQSAIERDIFYSKESLIWLINEALGANLLPVESSFDQVRIFISTYAFS